MDGDYYQYAYVTNDIDRAIDALRKTHGMGPFQELRDMHLPVGPDREAVGHFALAFKGALQFELIQPLAGEVDFYRELLPSKDFIIAFHHLGKYVASKADYDATLAAARETWSLPIDYTAFGGFYAYVDARPLYGHYLEYICFPDSDHLSAVPRY